MTPPSIRPAMRSSTCTPLHTSHASFRDRLAGVTLIELMIVIVIVAFLATMGYPGYIDYLIRGRIPEATSTLADGKVRMEQFFQDNKTYVNGPCPAATGSFAYVCNSLTANTYTITANGTGNRVNGFSFAINQNNARTTQITGGAAWPAGNFNCWVQRRGAC